MKPTEPNNPVEYGYAIPKDIIELLIHKYAPTRQCCDFCDRSHTLNEICAICNRKKVRCGS